MDILNWYLLSLSLASRCMVDFRMVATCVIDKLDREESFFIFGYFVHLSFSSCFHDQYIVM